MTTTELLEQATQTLSSLCDQEGQSFDDLSRNSKPVLYDLVLEGGGLRGIAHLGVLYALEQFGVRFRHLGGTSAGALTAAMLAMNTKPITESRTAEAVSLTFDLDYMAFVDGGDDVKRLLDQDEGSGFAGGKVVAALKNISGLIRNTSVNPSEAFIPELEERLKKHLSDFFESDLQRLKSCRAEQARQVAEHFTIDERYAIPEFQAVVINLYLARKEILPRDLIKYGIRDPDGISLLSIVKASAAIPFFFAPVGLGEIVDLDGLDGTEIDLEQVLYADGGVVDNFPVDLFSSDRFKDDPVKCLFIELTEHEVCAKPIENTLDVAMAIYRSVFHQKKVLSDHQEANHISVDLTKDACGAVDMLSFNLTQDQQQALFLAGVRAGCEWFLKHRLNG